MREKSLDKGIETEYNIGCKEISLYTLLFIIKRRAVCTVRKRGAAICPKIYGMRL